MRFWRKRHRLREIGETEAYDRAYGQPSDTVKPTKLPPRRRKDPDVLKTGEELRKAFLDRLENREDEKEK